MEPLRFLTGGQVRALEREFGSPKVNHMFERAFNFMGRNAFFISVRGRILLGEDQVSQAEQHIYDRIAEITKASARISRRNGSSRLNGALRPANQSAPSSA